MKRLEITFIGGYHVEDYLKKKYFNCDLEKLLNYIKVNNIPFEQIGSPFKDEVLKDLLTNGMKSSFIIKH